MKDKKAGKPEAVVAKAEGSKPKAKPKAKTTAAPAPTPVQKPKAKVTKAKNSGVVTITELSRRFDRRAEVVLAEYLEPMPREKGEQRSYQVKVALPNYEQFVRMQAAVYRLPLSKQVDIAKGEFNGISEELTAWYDSMPAGFKAAEHGQQIAVCRDDMNGVAVGSPDVPKSLSNVPVLFVPPENLDAGRPEKRDAAVARVEACIASLIELDEDEPFIGEMKAWIAEANAIKFPSMFT